MRLTTTKKPPPQQKHEEETVVEEELSESVLNHVDGEIGPRNPLFTEVLPLFEKQSYVILRDATHLLRQWHIECPGINDKLYFTKNAKKAFVAEYPVVVIDVARYPSVASDGEWEYYIKQKYPNVRECVCGLRLFMKDSRTFKRRNLTLTSNYFYLTGLNAPENDIIWHCQLAQKSQK